MIQWAYFAPEHIDSPVELIWSDNQLEPLTQKGSVRCAANVGTMIPHSMRYT